jgi:hypothetical protein
MIELIRNHNILQAFVREECCENDVSVTIDGELGKEDVIILSVDSYYNSLNLRRPPASVDCLIIVRCRAGDYKLFIVELKNISSRSGYSSENLREKFVTTLDDFVSVRFPFIGNANIRDVKLFFVSKIGNYKRDGALMMDVLINMRFSFRGKKLLINPRMPTPRFGPC